MASTLSPVPWRAYASPSGHIVTDRDGNLVARLPFQSQGEEMDESNLRAITAAPDAIAVCRRIVEAWDTEETVWVGTVEDARAVIAQADGRDA